MDKTLYLERSTGEARDGLWTDRLSLDGVNRIVVGTGPGSFAGIRSALAFAQGYALGTGAAVLGLPSPCAICADCGGEGELAVVGDARRGKCWIALFNGLELTREVFQVEAPELAATVGERKVVSPDDRRIGAMLRETFGERYLGERLPTSEGLKAYAEAMPSALKSEPLPIYLNPAVRD